MIHNTVKRRILLILFFFSLTLPVFPFDKQIGKVTENVPVRVDSTILATEIGQVKKDTPIEIIGKSYNWYKIKLPKYFPGYVYASYIEVSKDKRRGKSIVNNLNIRNKPILNSEVIGELNQGQEVFIENQDNKWLKIKAYPYSTGWIHNRYVETDTDITVTNVVPRTEISQTSIKEKELNSNNKTKEEDPILEKPIATGRLIRTQDIYDRTIYRLQNENGAIRLKLDLPHGDPEEHINKTVHIWGKLERSKNNYYLRVTNIRIAK